MVIESTKKVVNTYTDVCRICNKIHEIQVVELMEQSRMFDDTITFPVRYSYCSESNKYFFDPNYSKEHIDDTLYNRSNYLDTIYTIADSNHRTATVKRVQHGIEPKLTANEFIHDMFPKFFKGTNESMDKLITNGNNILYKFRTINYDTGYESTRHNFEAFVQMDLSPLFNSINSDGVKIILNIYDKTNGEHIYQMILNDKFLGDKFTKWINTVSKNVDMD